jgi:hypothetical protein
MRILDVAPVMDMRGALAADTYNGHIYALIRAQDRPVAFGAETHSSDCHTGRTE